jgi:hypothetical protein
VLRDVQVEWAHPELLPHAPDVCVVMGVRNKDAFRGSFVVADEGVHPCFVLEVVSPRYRKADRETKVEEYELAGVQEYVIIDRLTRRGQISYEILGYRLVRGRYRLIDPDEDGRMVCQTIGLWLSMRDGELVMEDAQTGERLLTARELDAARRAMADENAQLKAKLAALEAELTRRSAAP